MDVEGQQDQHTPLGTATACISEWLLEYSMEQHGLMSRSPLEQETQGARHPCNRPVLAPEVSLFVRCLAPAGCNGPIA